jgi:hypothetical protein
MCAICKSCQYPLKNLSEGSLTVRGFYYVLGDRSLKEDLSINTTFDPYRCHYKMPLIHVKKSTQSSPAGLGSACGRRFRYLEGANSLIYVESAQKEMYDVVNQFYRKNRFRAEFKTIHRCVGDSCRPT